MGKKDEQIEEQKESGMELGSRKGREGVVGKAIQGERVIRRNATT